MRTSKPGGSNLRRLWRDRSGAYSIVTALMLPVLVGFAGFGTEAGLWFFDHQKMQGAADAAAYSAGLAYSLGNTAGYSTEAKAVAAQYGFVDGSGGTTVTVNQPPASGSHTATTGAVEVIIQQSQQRLFSAVLTSSALNIAARAVATQNPGHSVCVLGLDPSAANTVSLTNNATLPNPNCALASNSSSASGLSLSNNAVVDGPTTSHGGDSLANNSALNGTPNLTNAATIPDPYASENPPAPPTCTAQNGVVTGPHRGTLQVTADTTVNGVGVTHFCSGLNFSNNISVNFAPGIYFIDQQFIVSNNATLSGSGVTFVINGNYAIGCATCTPPGISNNAILNLQAPGPGTPTAGIVFFGLRNATSTVTQTFSNNTVLNLTGAVYFPNQIVNFDNNASSSGANGCTQIIGRQVTLSNNVSLGANCPPSTGVTPMGFGGAVALVE